MHGTENMGKNIWLCGSWVPGVNLLLFFKVDPPFSSGWDPTNDYVTNKIKNIQWEEVLK